jgi:hypothetical protein
MRLYFAPLLLCAAAHATPADTTEQCIVADHAIGCRSERAIVELTTRHDGTLPQLVQDRLASGQCRAFDYGERVRRTASHGNDLVQVRRPGDKTAYWIPSAWSHPASDCADTPTAAALHKKLGLPDATPWPPEEDERIASFTDQRGLPSRTHGDDYGNDDYGDVDDGYGDARYDDEGYRDTGYGDNDRDYSNQDPDDREGAGRDDGNHYIDNRSRVERSYVDRSRSERVERSDSDHVDRPDADRSHVDRYPGEHDTHHHYATADDDDFIRDDRRRPPPWPSRPLPSSRYAHCDNARSDAEGCAHLRRTRPDSSRGSRRSGDNESLALPFKGRVGWGWCCSPHVPRASKAGIERSVACKRTGPRPAPG